MMKLTLTDEERQLLEAEHPLWSHEDKRNDENYAYPCLVQRALLTIDALREYAAKLETALDMLGAELGQARQSYATLNEYCDYRLEQADALAGQIAIYLAVPVLTDEQFVRERDALRDGLRAYQDGGYRDNWPR